MLPFRYPMRLNNDKFGDTAAAVLYATNTPAIQKMLLAHDSSRATPDGTAFRSTRLSLLLARDCTRCLYAPHFDYH